MIPVQSWFRSWGLDAPEWALALGFALMGWMLAILLRFLIAQSLRMLRFDKLSDKAGMTDFLRKGQIAFVPSQLAGVAVFWAVLITALLQASFVLDSSLAQTLLTNLALALPRVLAAGLTLVTGWALVSFASNFTLTLARNAAWPHAGLLARAVKVVGLVLVIALTAEQADLHIAVFSSLFLIIAGAVAFGLALAFGLGCQDLARDAMKRFLARLRERDASPRGPDLEG